MSNENKALFEAFAAKASSVHIIGGTFGTTDVELSIQRHNDNKLQVSVGGLDAPFAITLLDALGIKVDGEEGKSKKRGRKIKREAEKLAVEDAEEDAAEDEAPVVQPANRRQSRVAKAEVVAEEAKEVPAAKPRAKPRSKRRTKAEMAAARAAEEAEAQEEEEEEEEVPVEPLLAKKASKRRTKAEMATARAAEEVQEEEEPKAEDDFSLNDAEVAAIGAATVVEDVIEIVLDVLDALPGDLDVDKAVSAVVSVRNNGIAPALKGWKDADIAEVVNTFFG
jgi:hypothetical protein